MKSISEEIKQLKFDTNYQMAVINLLYTSNVVADKHAVIFKKYDILEQHFNILRIVSGRQGKPISPGEIIEVMLNKNRDLTRLVDKLTKMELLDRQVNPTNRRKVNIAITKNGESVLEKINAELKELMYANVPLTEEESLELSQLLDKLRG